MIDVRPRELGDVDQTVDPVEVDEGAEVDDVRNLALHDVSRVQAIEDPFAILLALLLEHRPPREHHVVARPVEFDDPALNRLAHVLVEVGNSADIHQRGGEEAAHPQIDDQATLDNLDDLSLDRLAGVGGPLDPAPGLLEPGALLGQDEASVLILLGEHERIDLFAEVNLVAGIDGLADRELGSRYDAL